jgi:purine nucleosidase
MIIDWLKRIKDSLKSPVSITTAFEWEAVVDIATKANLE